MVGRPALASRRVRRAPAADPEELRLALEAAEVGAWALDLRTGDLHTAGSYGRLIAGPTAPPDFVFARSEDVLAVVHPEDRALVAGSPERISRQGGSFAEEFRLAWPNGQVRWLASRGQVVTNAAGRPVKVAGILVDVTEQRRAELQSRELLAAEQVARTQAQEGQRRVAQLESVTEAGLAHLSVDDLLAELLGRVREAVSVESVVVWLSDDAGRLVPGAAVGMDLKAAPVLSTRDSDWLLQHRPGPLVLPEGESPHVPGSRLQPPGVRSLAIVRLVVEGRATGVLQVGSRLPRQFKDGDLRLLQLVADRMALAIDRARTYGQNHRAAETLQRSLLPDRLPEVPGLALARAYLPGAGAAVGGDWYDVIDLPGDELALVTGDVVGRRAASVMGHLRGACRIFASQGQPAATVVQCLNDLAHELGGGELATLAYVVLDVRTGRARSVSAGHPPALVRGTDGRCTYLDGEPQPPLGALRDWRYAEHPFLLKPGALLLLYTDGLIERRDASLELGLAELAAALSHAPPQPEECGDSLVAALLGSEPTDDDTALLVVRRVRSGPGPLDLRLPADLSTLRPLRQRLRAWLEGVGALGDEVYDLTLATSEAAANAIEHGYAPTEATYLVQASCADGVVEVRVRDFGRWRAPRDSGRGRGLLLMHGLVDEVLVDRREESTDVRLRRTLAGGPCERPGDKDRAVRPLGETSA